MPFTESGLQERESGASSARLSLRQHGFPSDSDPEDLLRRAESWRFPSVAEEITNHDG